MGGGGLNPESTDDDIRADQLLILKFPQYLMICHIMWHNNFLYSPKMLC